ncbi:MAG: hypothetical protein MZU97_19370 [Bacillus subtilis]|nr:hypothetical protein [Bacillus subtilis]
MDEAFELMNQAIENFHEAESFHLNYSGMYENPSYFAEDRIDVRMRSIGKANFLGRVEMTIVQNNNTYTAINFYDDGTLYTRREDSDGVKKVKFIEEASAFIDVYSSFDKNSRRSNEGSQRHDSNGQQIDIGHVRTIVRRSRENVVCAEVSHFGAQRRR